MADDMSVREWRARASRIGAQVAQQIPDSATRFAFGDAIMSARSAEDLPEPYRSWLEAKRYIPPSA